MVALDPARGLGNDEGMIGRARADMAAQGTLGNKVRVFTDVRDIPDQLIEGFDRDRCFGDGAGVDRCRIDLCQNAVEIDRDARIDRHEFGKRTKGINHQRAQAAFRNVENDVGVNAIMRIMEVERIGELAGPSSRVARSVVSGWL